MAFRPADVMRLIWSHPIVSVVVLLLFTPPLFPIVVYFSPLLISTALFVVAMISMGSNVDDDPRYTSDVPYKRSAWIEASIVDGPQLEGERVPKRLKASSRDETWFDKVKNWEGTGRAWVESVISQEARSVSSDDNASIREESIPLLASAKRFLLDENRGRSLEADDESKSIRPVSDEQILVTAKDSAPGVSSENLERVDHRPGAAPQGNGNRNSEITTELDSDDELIEIATANIPPSSLFENSSLPEPDASENFSTEALKKKTAGSKDAKTASEPTELVTSMPATDSGGEKKIASESDSTIENKRVLPAQDHAERTPSDADSVSNTEEIALNDLHSSKESSQEAKSQNSAAEETKLGTKASSDSKVLAGADRNLADKGQANVVPQSNNGKSIQSKEVKSAAELIAPLRYGLATPSAAVALSEKLKVPLADIMSLLAGDDKENVPNEQPSGVKESTSTETTTSQDEEWSSSDEESTPPLESVGGPSTAEKKAV